MDFYYENLLEETKVFLNKAMDFYASIKDIKIEDFSERDKRILSILAASFLAEGELKDIISKFDDLSFEKLLEFMEVEDVEIKPLDGDYKSFYDEFFKQDIETMDIANKDKQMYKKTPTVIFSYFHKVLVINSSILNAFAAYCEFKSPIFGIHPVFKEIEQHLEHNSHSAINDSRWQSLYQNLDASPEKRDDLNIQSSKTDFLLNHGKVPIDRAYNRGLGLTYPMPRSRYAEHFTQRYGIEYEKDEEKNQIDEKEQKRLDELAYLESDEIWQILDEIKLKFIGQEQAVEDIFYNIINNQRMILNDDLQDGERSIMFIDGPTGTGKTAIITEITDRLNIPFVRTSSTKFSPAGYKGEDIESTLEQLLKKADRDIEKAQKGIIVFDEFDKLVYNPEEGNGLDIKKAVQQQLLDFMGGGTYKVSIMQSLFGNISADFDTSKLTFICLGALTNLRENKSVEKKSTGFNASIETKKKESYEITPQDLINLGYERELVGRINTYLHTEEYSKEDLLRILKESTISPMKGFINLVNSYHKELVIEDGVYEAIVDNAYEYDTGIRGVQATMNSIRSIYLKELMRSKEPTVYLDVESVNRACKNSITRKSRR